MLLIYLFVFLFGLIVGSFLNVVALRYNTGKSAMAGRSECFSCGKMLHWHELVPLFSFLVQKGRCRGCGSRISRQYFWTELSTGLLFVLVALNFSDLASLVYYWAIASLLVVITIYDLKHKIIPDSLVFTFIALALFRPFVFSSTSGVGEILGSLAGGVILFAFFSALWLFSGGRWMGFGDAKLAFGIGVLLGIRGGLNAVLFAFWTGAVFGLALIFIDKTKHRLSRGRRARISFKTEIPFAPFLFLGIIANLLLGFNILSF